MLKRYIKLNVILNRQKESKITKKVLLQKMKQLPVLRRCRIENKRVILRCDFNVVIQNGKILDDTRIRAVIPTIKCILSKKPKKLIIISHLGRPSGFDKSLSLKPVAEHLSKLLRRKVVFKTLSEELETPERKGIVLLENIRFYKQEVQNDSRFAYLLSTLGDVFVNDAFATMHRKHASTYGLAKYLKSCIGLLVEEEIKNLDFSNKKKPIAVVLGGSKLSTKLPVIKSLIKKVDYVLLGGAMIFTFYKAQGFNVGKSLYEPEMLNEAKSLLNSKKIILPDDVVISRSLDKAVSLKTVPVSKIPSNFYGVDVGHKSILKFVDVLLKSKTIFWNGPLGKYEVEDFRQASEELANFIALMSNAYKIVGGGDTLTLLNELKLLDKFDFVSTGGGASLEYIAKGTLPFLELLKKKK
ncbi:MAG: phosphoglycerate kinase [Candidatus Woesearchaeota archaeon]|nr:phosphoglycerate kinase [Candidatus Woesearchaeota archaeon]MDN5327644.1 phosphoglycerate kinase [Candidatus Woesearchaeota archaeon]